MPPTVAKELVVVGVRVLAGGPASVRVASPAQGMSGQVASDRANGEDDVAKSTGEAQVFDAHTGGALPLAMVATAREKDVSMMEAGDAWEVITEETRRLAGKRPPKGDVCRL